MFEPNGRDRQYPTRLAACDSTSSRSDIENINSEESDSSNPQRVMIATAAAGALTAAMILAGWGIHIDRNEADLLRTGLSASKVDQGDRFSFFHAMDNDYLQGTTVSHRPTGNMNRNDEAQEGEDLTIKTARVEQLNTLNEQLRKYARKRTKLQRIIVELRAFETKRNEVNDDPRKENEMMGTHLTEQAKYRTLLHQAAKLRDELEKLSNESLSNMYYANQSQSHDQSTTFKPMEPSGESIPLDNENDVPYEIIAVKNNTVTNSPTVKSYDPDLRTMNIMNRAQYHTNQLIARLEKTRLVVTTRLAAVSWYDDQPVQ